jgi:UDP-glucuronate 4-epimerase
VKAEIEFLPMQPGDVKETYADIDATKQDFGFVPSTSIDQGIPKFVEWYKTFYNV